MFRFVKKHRMGLIVLSLIIITAAFCVFYYRQYPTPYRSYEVMNIVFIALFFLILSMIIVNIRDKRWYLTAASIVFLSAAAVFFYCFRSAPAGGINALRTDSKAYGAN